MRKGFAVVLVCGLFGCSQASQPSGDEKAPVSPSQPQPDDDPSPVAQADPDPDPEPDPQPVAAASPIEVHMTSATLADDCGGGPNTRPKKMRAAKGASRIKGDRSRKAKAKRRCEQSSIQLAITAPADAEPASMAVKSVELFLESGDSIGTLDVRAPSVWTDDDGYAPWDEKVEPAQELSVSYALTQPDWSKVADRWNQTYTVKAVLSIAGADQTLEHDVVVDAPTSLPPNVKT